jgi:hypothetical protein
MGKNVIFLRAALLHSGFRCRAEWPAGKSFSLMAAYLQRDLREAAQGRALVLEVVLADVHDHDLLRNILGVWVRTQRMVS